MMREIAGMSVLITGGGSGLGAGAATYFAERGARVTIAGRRADRLAAVAAPHGHLIECVTGDVTREGERAAMVAAAVAHGGGLDLLVNAAGNMLRGPITELDADAVLSLFHANVVGGMMLVGLAVPHLQTRRGAIVWFGSVHNRRAFPGASPYAATKAAIETLTRVLAAELGPRGIRVNCVVPGAVPTEINTRAGLYDEQAATARMAALAPLHALGRIGTAEEIAEAIDYLARAEWTTGAVVEVDGGLGLATADF